MITNISGSKVPFKLIEGDRSNAKYSFTAKGAINADSSKVLKHKLAKYLNTEQARIHIEMSEVTFLGSSGIRVLLEIYKKVKTLGGILKIINPSENVKNVMGMTALDELLF